MLDKTKLYYVNSRKKDVVQILFEDNISWYVETVAGAVDSHNNPIRRSCKKTRFRLDRCITKHVFFAEVIPYKAYEVEGDYAEARKKLAEFLAYDDDGKTLVSHCIADNVTITRRADLDRSKTIGTIKEIT